MKLYSDPNSRPKDDEFTNGETTVFYNEDGEQQVRFNDDDNE